MMLGGGYLLNMALLYVFVDVQHISASKVQLACIVLVSIYFYVANKFYVHRHVN